MQKKLIALAVASLASGAAFAQTNVTMYGIADAGYVYSQGNSAGSGRDYKFSGIQSGLLSGSRLGFRGEEALGNGLKAIFTLEYSLNIDNNSGVGSTGGLNARQQFVGLSSASLGTIALGRQYAPGYDATVNNDPFAGATFSPEAFLTQSGGNTISPTSNARWNNTATYKTPNFSGFTAKAIYSFGESTLNNGVQNLQNMSVVDNGAYGLGANYANGPVNVDLVWQSRDPVAVAAGSGTGLAALMTVPASPGNLKAAGYGKSIDEWYIGGTFDLKFMKLMGSYQQQKDDNISKLDNTVWGVGAVIPVGNGNIHLGYSQLMWDQGRLRLANGQANGFNGLTDTSQSAAIAYTHSLSKRTTLYTGYVWVSNDKSSTGANPIASAGPAPLPSLQSGVGVSNEDNNTFLAGVRHAF